LRHAVDTQDIAELRYAVNEIQKGVDGKSEGRTLVTPPTDGELKEIMETGSGMIVVGTGTLGQRIYLKDNELSMFEPSDGGGETYRANFRRLFNLPEDEEDLRAKF